MGDTDPDTAGLPLVLVVDDYEDNRAMYAEFLTMSGFRVAQASDGQEAIDKATSLRPDVIVMDLSLPKVDGWEAARQLRTDPRTSSIRIIALSGHASADLVNAARASGCDTFLSKPCMPETLLASVKAMLAAPTKG